MAEFEGLGGHYGRLIAPWRPADENWAIQHPVYVYRGNLAQAADAAAPYRTTK